MSRTLMSIETRNRALKTKAGSRQLTQTTHQETGIGLRHHLCDYEKVPVDRRWETPKVRCSSWSRRSLGTLF